MRALAACAALALASAAPAQTPVQAIVVEKPHYGTPRYATGELFVLEYGVGVVVLEFGGDGIFRSGFEVTP